MLVVVGGCKNIGQGGWALDEGVRKVPPIAWFKDPAGNVLSVVQV